MRENEKLFHSRIFRIYLDYLRSTLHWSETQIDDFLSSIHTTRERLEDESSWVDVQFADQFYYRLQELTGDSNLAYNAGIFVNKKSLSPIFHQLLRGLMDVSFLYKVVAKFSGYFSKAARFNVVSVGVNTAHLEATPVDGFDERPYMCENRRGTLAGLPKVFGLECAEIQEAECFHKGGKKCSYHLKWQRTSQWVQVFRAGGLLLTATAFVASLSDAITGFIALLVGTILLGTYFTRRLFSVQRQELLNQNEALDQTLSQVERKNRELQLVNRIAQLTHSLTSPKELAQTLVKSVCEILNYDRAVLLTVDSQRHILEVSAHFGFDPQMQELLSHAEFNIRADSEGFFIRVVNTRSPVLITDVPTQIAKLSARSQKFAKILGAQSFVAVPLTDEHKNVIGVLSVDNVAASRTMGITDQDLLMTLSEHLGIALHNAKIMGQLAENLEMARRFSNQQKLLREAFQKFVPSDMALDISSIDSIETYQSRISQVRKRSASILFLDIFNFSSMADKMPPEDVIDLLNTAFQIFEPIVAEHGGFIDKFTGDGLIAIFEEKDKSFRACSAAIALIRSVAAVNEQLHAKGYEAISVGIGINFGQVILGNIGSKDRLNFTVIGEAVNMASRLEAHTRILGPNTICASALVRSRSGDLHEWKDLGSVKLKGYVEPVQVFELAGAESKSGAVQKKTNHFND